MSLYDVERFESRPDPDLICCICHCVLDNPMESPCQHVFCKICIETWLNNHNSCPSCRKRLRESKLKPALPIVKNMISRLIIKCENADQGCKAKVQLEHYKTHISDCDFVQINCMNTGCVKIVFRKNMYCHEKECQYRLVPCKKGCGLPVAAKDASSHKCVEELKDRLQKLEDNVDNFKKDTEMRLVQLENIVAEIQNRGQQDSSASDVDQEDDNSRDSPDDDDDANDPDSDEDEYQSEGGAGDDSGDDDEDDDDNGSNNDEDDEEEDYDQDSDGGNSRSYESSSSVEYASDTSSYRDYTDYPRVDNSDDADSNDSMSVEEINTPSSPPSTARRPSTTSGTEAGQTRNVSNSAVIGRDISGWVVSTSRGTVTPIHDVTRPGGSAVSTQQRNQQVNIHTALNSANTRLPPPPPYRPTSSSATSSSSPINMVSVSTVTTSAPSRPGVVSVVSTSPGVSVVPTSPPEIKMQVSFQVISRGQATSTGTSTVTRANSGGAPLIPIQLYSPVSNTSSTPSSCTQVRANRSTLSIATVTSTQTRPGGSSLIRPITNTTHGLPIPLRRGLSQADARAALRPLATGSGSVIASRIPGTRRRRNVPSRFRSSSSREHRHRRSSSSRHGSQSGEQRNSSTATSSAAPANLSATASSSHSVASSPQVSTTLSSTAAGGSQSTRSSQSPNTTVNRPNQSRVVSNSVPTPAASSGRTGPAVASRSRNPTVAAGGSRLARPSGEAEGAQPTPTDIQIRALKRRHNDDSSSDESDVTHPSPSQRARQVSHCPVRPCE